MSIAIEIIMFSVLFSGICSISMDATFGCLILGYSIIMMIFPDQTKINYLSEESKKQVAQIFIIAIVSLFIITGIFFFIHSGFLSSLCLTTV